MNSRTVRNAGVALGVAALLYVINRSNRQLVDPNTVPDLNASERPTMPRVQAREIADAIDAAIYKDSFYWGWGFGALGENEERIIRLLTQEAIRTTGDVLLVAEEYGTRGQFFTPDYTLMQALGAYMEPAQLSSIKEVWRQRGIRIEAL